MTKFGTLVAELGAGRASKKVGLWGVGEPSRLRAGARCFGRAGRRVWRRLRGFRLWVPVFVELVPEPWPARWASLELEEGPLAWPAGGASVSSFTNLPGSGIAASGVPSGTSSVTV